MPSNVYEVEPATGIGVPPSKATEQPASPDVLSDGDHRRTMEAAWDVVPGVGSVIRIHGGVVSTLNSNPWAVSMLPATSVARRSIAWDPSVSTENPAPYGVHALAVLSRYSIPAMPLNPSVPRSVTETEEVYHPCRPCVPVKESSDFGGVRSILKARSRSASVLPALSVERNAIP